MKVALWGCGGHASVVADTMRLQNRHELAAYIVDDLAAGAATAGVPVFTADQLARVLANGVAGLVVAVGDQAARLRIADAAGAAGFTLCTIIHPST